MDGYIGIDLGGTKISGVLIDQENHRRDSAVWPTKAGEGEAAVCGQLFGLISRLLEAAKSAAVAVLGIGIGVPGAVDSEAGRVVYAANLPLRDFPLVEILQDKYKLPIFMENDANAAALAEYQFGAGRGSCNMLFVTVSTGIGAGAVLNGQLYRGSTGNALELGHITIAKDGRPCGCGNCGCAELYASGSAIAQIALAAIRAGEVTALQENTVTAERVFAAAAAGDALAAGIVKQALRDLGACLSVAAGLFDPDVIILGGGVAQAGELLFTEVERVLQQRCLPPVAAHVKVLPAAFKSEAGVYGAAALAMKGTE